MAQDMRADGRYLAELGNLGRSQTHQRRFFPFDWTFTHGMGSMKRFKFLHVVAATLASVGMLASQSVAWAAGPQNLSTRGASQQVLDVALGNGGRLQGQLVDVSGTPQANAEVTVRLGDTVVAVTKTDERGYFSVEGLRGGVYEINTQGTSSLYRLWAANTAPPTAQAGALLVEAGDVVRGNLFDRLGTGNGLGLAALIGGSILIGGLVEHRYVGS